MVCADVMEWAKGYEGEPFHALLCDPPYNFQFMGKDWDNAVAMHPETWAVLAEHLYPGAFIFAFGGARTYHRLAVAMEDAGLRIHPAIGWVNGQGFPKSTKVKDALNFEGHRYGGQVLKPCLEFIAVAQKPYEGKPVDCITETGAGALWVKGGRVGTEDNLGGGAYATDKHKVGGIYGKLDYDCGDYRQPQGRWPSNFVLSHISPSICPDCDGTGGIDFPTWYARERENGGTLARWKELTGGMSCWVCLKCDGAGVVGGCRQVGVKKVRGSRIEKPCEYEGDAGAFGNKGDRPARGIGDAGGMETVAKWECVERCPVRMLAEQSGDRSSARKSGNPNNPKRGGNSQPRWGMSDGRETKDFRDTGTAARYFFQSDWSHEVAERLGCTNPAFYCPKASRRERDIGLTTLPLQTFSRVNPGGQEHEPRWAPTKVRNPHPTIKPITLNRYLATLLLPPDIYAPRRLLIPFAGVASEMIGAYLAGWEEIVGIEMSQEYCDIGEMRLDWWRRAGEEARTTDAKKILKWARRQE